MATKYTVGVYYFPNYHVDPRNEKKHGIGWTEWELMKTARPRFDGHRQPRVPLWGYEDEADPLVMEKKIDAAADHGVDYWLFDWYWYDDGPFLNRCLDEGYMQAQNNERVKFCCHWANHHWINLHPAKHNDPRMTDYSGTITSQTFDEMTSFIVENYFKHPSHFNVEGCPYFSIYDLTRLLESFGGVKETRRALAAFRSKTQAAGFPDLHLNAVVWGNTVLPGEEIIADPAQLVKDLGFSSVTSYVWIHHVAMPDFPLTDYMWVCDQYLAYWDKAEQTFDLPYIPNATMGWDSSPRTVQSDRFELVGYPFTPIMAENTPERFHEALLKIRTRMDQRTGSALPTMNINAWNEWTEGSYLEPDTEYGMGYLEAIRDVFGYNTEGCD